jgi:pyrroloquinoline quinone biosynthesis protein D
MSKPRLAAGVRLRWDERRQSWVLLGPEKVVLADTVAAEILQRLDGATSTGQIADALSRTYEATPETIEKQILVLVDQLASEGLVRP